MLNITTPYKMSFFDIIDNCQHFPTTLKQNGSRNIFRDIVLICTFYQNVFHC